MCWILDGFLEQIMYLKIYFKNMNTCHFWNYFLAHFSNREDHIRYLWAIFLRCHYNIFLNPHKSIFCVEAGWLLGFIISRHGIYVDPLKFEAIINFPLPRTISQLQSLYGKEKFLRHFITNYVEITKGFMMLLKKGVLFVWDD